MYKNKRRRFIIKELKPVDEEKCGRAIINCRIKAHERETVLYLTGLGFDVETIAPSNMPGSNNPDLLMAGTFWEMKASWSIKKSTLASKFRKAVKQAGGRAIFDLRNIRKTQDAQEAEKIIMDLFGGTRGMRRIILIRKTGEALDILK